MAVTCRHFGLPLLFSVVFLGGCDSGAPVLREGVTLKVSANPSTIKNFGDVSQITIRAVQADGAPPPNGSPVTLQASDGSIPTTVRLTNGSVIVPFQSGANIGSVTISASSGTLGLDDSIQTTVEVIDGRVVVSQANLSMNPSQLPAIGGQVQLGLRVIDSVGEVIPGKAVLFSTDRGGLNSNGRPVWTDEDGIARDLLSVPILKPSATEVAITAQVDQLLVTGTVTISNNLNPTVTMVVSPDNPQAGEPISFDGSTSSDADGTIQRYVWRFGDGAQAQGAVVSHRYQQAGTYQVILTVTDDFGAMVSGVLALTVGENQAPTSAFSVSPTDPKSGEPVLFDGSTSSDADGSIVSYRWEFGDGSSAFIGPTVSHIFPGKGTYEVVLTVTDDDGASSRLSQLVEVDGNSLPTAALTVTPENPNPGDEIVFDGSASTDSDGSIQRYRWDFGDGSPVVETTQGLTRHRYNTIGTYSVVLTVRDDDGGLGFALATITVSANQAPTAAFTFLPEAPNPGDRIGFDASTSMDADGEIVRYDWDFGDGGQGSSNSPLISYTYTGSGTYVVFLTATDNEGGRGFASASVTLSDNQIPVAAFTVNPEAPSIEDLVAFDGGTSSDPDGTIEGYSWDFGDGGRGSGQIATYTYNSAGSFPVVLTVRDNLGAEHQAVQVVTVAFPQKAGPRLRTQWLDPDRLLLDASESFLMTPESELEDVRFVYHPPAGRPVVLAGNGPLRVVPRAHLSGESQPRFSVEIGRVKIAGQPLAFGANNPRRSLAAPGSLIAAMSLEPVKHAPGTWLVDAGRSRDPRVPVHSLRYEFDVMGVGAHRIQLAGVGARRLVTLPNEISQGEILVRARIHNPMGESETLVQSLGPEQVNQSTIAEARLSSFPRFPLKDQLWVDLLWTQRSRSVSKADALPHISAFSTNPKIRYQWVHHPWRSDRMACRVSNYQSGDLVIFLAHWPADTSLSKPARSILSLP